MKNIKTEKDYNLPKCPEVCSECELGRHIAHFIDEMGDLTISLSENKKYFKIEGYTEAGDYFWLESILHTAHHNIPK